MGSSAVDLTLLGPMRALKVPPHDVKQRLLFWHDYLFPPSKYFVDISLRAVRSQSALWADFPL